MVLALITPLLAGAWVAAHRFMADATLHQARFYIDRWHAAKIKLPPAKLDELQADLTWAINLDPANPYLHEDLARFMSWRSERGNLLDPSTRTALALARTHFTEAARLRPSAERAWSGVAQMRYMLGEVDSQFGAALELALRLGPWNSEIQMATIHIGVATWQILTPELQQQFKRAIYNQAHWKLAPQKARLELLIKAFGLNELKCLLEASGPKACPPG